MSDQKMKALKNAMASSAMEGMPINDEQLNIIVKILDGEMSLQEYIESVKLKYGDAM